MLRMFLDLGPSYTVLLFFVGYLGYCVLQAIFDPLRHIPGPLIARVTRLWYIWQIYKGKVHFTEIDLHKKYGPVVRVAPKLYSIDDVEAAKTIYGSGTRFVKSPWYLAWMVPEAKNDTRKANLFGDQDPVHHAMQRRKYSSAYAMSSLISYEPFVDECCALLVQRFNEIAASHQKVPLNHWLQCFAFDVIGYITFGGRFGLLDFGVDKSNILKAIESRFFYATFVGFFPYLHRFLLQLMPKTGGFAYMLFFSKQQMQAREKALKDPNDKNQDGPPDAVSKLLRTHEVDPMKMSKEDILILATTNIGAGADSTSITLSTVMYHLIKNPSTYNRLQSEIDDAAKTGMISDPIAFKEAQELPYLQAVIKEALRIHPAVGLPLQRVVPPEGATLVGHNFPAGTIVGINGWVAHRNKSVYGADADRWRPERWLEFEEQGRGGEVEKYFFAFGMGSRNCIGKNISLLEMAKVIPQLLRNFDFVLDEGLEDREVIQKNRWFVLIKGFDGKILVREKQQI